MSVTTITATAAGLAFQSDFAPIFAVPRYSAGYVDLVPATNPTDVAVFRAGNYVATPMLRKISISGSADVAGTIDVFFQRVPSGGGGTLIDMAAPAKFDRNDRSTIGAPAVYTANRTSQGDGVSSSRPLIAQGRMTFKTSTIGGDVLIFSWPEGKGPSIRDLSQEFYAVNLRGAAMPTNAKLNITMEWDEYHSPLVTFVGDSTTSNANFLFEQLGRGYLNSTANILNRGSNGFRLQDYLLHTNGVTYSQGNVLSMGPSVLPFCFGINDVRQGSTNQSQLISMIDAAIHATLNGTIASSTYTSTMGAGTTFTWPATIPANPDCKIVLWGPNSFTLDDPGTTNFVTLTGLFSGMTIAQASQTATDILYDAYEAFRNDPRIHALIQKQDIFGRTCKTVSASGKMTDILHPNARGQVLSARQIKPTLDSVIKLARESIF